MLSSPHKPNHLSLLALAATCILWGTTWTVSKLAMDKAGIPALQLAYIRQCLAALCFLGYFLIMKRTPLPRWKDIGWLLGMSVLMMVMANGLSTMGLDHIPAGMASLLGATYPLCVVLIEWIFFNQRKLNKGTMLGIFIGLAGVTLVFSNQLNFNTKEPVALGLTLSVAALLSWSFGTVFLSRNKRPMNPYYAMGWQMLMGSAMVFLLSQLVQKQMPISSITWEGWAYVFYLVVAGSVLSFIAFIYTLKTLPVALSSMYAYINPIVAMITAYFFIGDTISWTTLMGALITLGGVYLVKRSSTPKESPMAEPEL